MKTQLAFYVKVTTSTTQLFCFYITNLTAGKKLLSRFVSNGNIVTAAYLNIIKDGKRIKSYPVNLEFFRLCNTLIPYLNSIS